MTIKQHLQYSEMNVNKSDIIVVIVAAYSDSFHCQFVYDCVMTTALTCNYFHYSKLKLIQTTHVHVMATLGHDPTHRTGC